MNTKDGIPNLTRTALKSGEHFDKSPSNNITEYLNSEKTIVSIMSNNNKGDNYIISNLSRMTQKSNKGWDISYIEKKDD